jgi:hypothetical protein
MATRLLVGLLIALAAGPAFAQSAREIRAAQDAGLSDRQLRMLMGAPSAFGEYRTSYSQLRWRLQRQLAREANAPLPERRTEGRQAKSEAEPADDAEVFPYHEQ